MQYTPVWPYHLSRHVYASSLMLLHVTCIFVTSIPKHISCVQMLTTGDLNFPLISTDLNIGATSGVWPPSSRKFSPFWDWPSVFFQHATCEFHGNPLYQPVFLGMTHGFWSRNSHGFVWKSCTSNSDYYQLSYFKKAMLVICVLVLQMTRKTMLGYTMVHPLVNQHVT